MRSARSKATDVSPRVRVKVLQRDGNRCIMCGSPYNLQMCHLVPRSLGGLGIEENLVTMCWECHTKSHNECRWIDQKVKEYLDSKYPDFTERRYQKYKEYDK